MLHTEKYLLKDIRLIDTELCGQLCKQLKPSKEVTVVMSTETSSSISLVRPLLKQLMSLCNNSGADEMAASLHELRQTIFNDLDTR